MSIGHLYILCGDVSIQVLCPFFNWIGFFLVLDFVSTLHILDINPLLDVSVNVFSHSVGCLLILLMISFAVQKLFNLMWSHLFILFVCLFPLSGEIYPKKFLRAMSKNFLFMFSSRIFMILWLTFMSFIYFAFILVYG